MKSFLELLLILVILPHTANAACTNPAADVGSMIYNTTEKVFQGCTQSQGWVAFHEPLPDTTPDTTPDAFGFVDQTGVAISTAITSNSVAISGIDSATTVSISGDGSPQFRIDGGSWVSSGTIETGQTLEIQLTSSALNSDTFTATITVGGVSADWLVTTEDAVVACSGTEVGGYCWFAGAIGDSCTTTCSSQGLSVDMDGTRDYAGSGGTLAQCDAVLQALSFTTAEAIVDANDSDIGCMYLNFIEYYMRGTLTTLANSSNSSAQRACACN